MDSELVFTPSEFVAVFNQTLEFAYPTVVIEGELCNFRISKKRWVYFNLQDENASVSFFGNVYQLPGPLENGLKIRVVGQPRLHERYGFSVNLLSVTPVGEGSLKKAADLLAKKLAAEELFAQERKRPLPPLPQTIGLITSAGSAAATDFIKILGERWGGVEILLHDAYVQGDQAPLSLSAAIEYFNRSAKVSDVLVITRGGGSAEDLSAFNDERVVRAVAASRIPTIVAIGHEIDLSLAELASDQRASTPSNAAQIVVPDKKHIIFELENTRKSLRRSLVAGIEKKSQDIQSSRKYLTDHIAAVIKDEHTRLASLLKLVHIFDPRAALKRGYAIISKTGSHINKTKQLSLGDKINIELSDGKINASVTGKS